jgi:hypothetical protein
MSATNAVRLRQRAQRLEVPDKPVSNGTFSVRADCVPSVSSERGIIYNWTSCGTRLVRKEANDNKTKEAAGEGRAASITIR